MRLRRQRASRSIKDIHVLLSMGNDKFEPQHVSMNYVIMRCMFWVSENYLIYVHT